ncbi:MAG: PqqD family protein [Lachnospiraceae bacterium]|nr:PqqD family protein [Lachnospiraceae bacterium]
MDLKKIIIKEGYILRELGGEFCIFLENDSEEGSLLGLPSVNETCLYLWEKLEQGSDTIELTELLRKHDDLDMEDAEYEVAEFLAKLIHGNVIEYE